MQSNQLTLLSPSKKHPAQDKKPLILSASRRTDLPGFYPRKCAELIRNKTKRLRTRYLYGVMFWSKQPLPFLSCPQLQTLVRELQNPLLQLTITGMGGTAMEPGIPSSKDIINALPRLIKLFKDNPERVRWRFDPILFQQNDITTFTSIADRMSELGILECTISFPTYFSLKGSLENQFYQAGIPKWDEDKQRQFLDKLIAIADIRGITLRSCAQPFVSRLRTEIKPAACVDGALFQKLHPARLPLDLPKDYSQRKHCNCVQSEDIGNYTEHICHGGCVYCYSKAGGPSLSK